MTSFRRSERCQGTPNGTSLPAQPSYHGIPARLADYPGEQAKGKYRYPDEEVFASIGYDWRGEIDALTGRETYSPALLDQLKLQVLLGERSARSVLDEYPHVYIRQDAVLEKLEQRFMREFATPTQRELRMEEYRWRTEARG